jgi:hypothetical protein
VADLSTVRASIMQALTALPANLYDHTPEVPMLPAIVLLPGDPYIAPIQLKRGQYQASFEIRIAVTSIDNQAGITNLEQLAFGVFESLPAGVIPQEVSQPQPLSLGMAEVIACTIPLTIPISTEE